MTVVTAAFEFTQKLPVPIAFAYAWSTDFRPDDIALLGKTGRRRVQRLNADTFILTDTMLGPDGAAVSKRKLMRLFPNTHMWTNTHIGGPNRHSQFLYALAAAGKGACVLRFTGRQANHVETAPSSRELGQEARALRAVDKGMWERLARAMEKDFGAGHGRGGGTVR